MIQVNKLINNVSRTSLPKFMYESWFKPILRFLVRLTLIDGLEELWRIPRPAWVLRWPGQVVIAGSQTAWTVGVENSILEYRVDEYFDEMLQQVTQNIYLN